MLTDHAAGRASDYQAAWALWWEAQALVRQERFEEAIEPLEMAAALGDPNHLDIRYKALDELRKVYEELVKESYEQGTSALFGDDDPETAQLYFEDAHAYSLKASGFRLDEICMHLARLAQREEDFDKAIAWFRLAINNPADLTGCAIEAANVVAWLYRDKKGQPHEEERWRLYLVNPGAFEDPTAPLVAAVLGTSPTESQEERPLMDFQGRLNALLKLYRSENRLDKAKTAFAEALAAATSDRERAGALAKIAYCQRELEGCRAALETADEAVELWLRVLSETTRDHDANYVLDLTRETYDIIGADDKALEVVEQITASLSLEQYPSRASYARLLLAREYTSSDRTAEAKQLLEETLGVILAEPFAHGYEWICVHMLIHLAFRHVDDGDFEVGRAWLDQIDARWPGKYDRELAIYHRAIDKKMTPEPKEAN